MNEMTFTILKVVVSVAMALITVYLIPYLKSQTQNKQNQQILDIIQTAVQAAEQVVGERSGKIKKQQVTEFVTKWLNEKNIKISEEQLSQLIESAVYAMNNPAAVLVSE